MIFQRYRTRRTLVERVLSSAYHWLEGSWLHAAMVYALAAAALIAANLEKF